MQIEVMRQAERRGGLGVIKKCLPLNADEAFTVTGGVAWRGQRRRSGSSRLRFRGEGVGRGVDMYLSPITFLLASPTSMHSS